MGSRLTLSPRAVAAVLSAIGGDAVSRQEVLADGVRKLSRLFTRERTGLGKEYWADDVLRQGYLAYFLPVNLAKARAVLDELPRPAWDSHEQNRSVRVLDIGCGPGAASLGVLEWMAVERPRASALEITLVDRSRRALGDAQRVIGTYATSALAQPVTVRQVQADLQRGGWARRLAPEHAGAFDLILLGNCLNELFDSRPDACARRTRVVERCLELLAQDGSLVIIEPATRREARAFHAVRDSVLARGDCNVYSPCLRDGPCPALVQPEDWCHEERPWEPPWLVSAIDQQVGFKKDALKFSYVILRRDGRTIVDRGPAIYRVVSELRVLKGERRAWVCNEIGRSEIGRLDRARSDRNLALDDWHRGAIIGIETLERRPSSGQQRSVSRVPAEGSVEIVRPV